MGSIMVNRRRGIETEEENACLIFTDDGVFDNRVGVSCGVLGMEG